MIIPYLKYATIVIPIIVVSMALLVHRFGPKNSNFDTISRHVSLHRKLFYLMATTITVLAVPYYAYIAFWLIPFYDLSIVMYAILIGAYIGLLFTVWVPATTGVRYKIHTFGATLVAFGMLSIGLALSLTDKIDFAGRLISIVFVVFSLFLIINGFFKLNKLNKLYSEALFIVIFYTMTVIATFF